MTFCIVWQCRAALILRDKAHIQDEITSECLFLLSSLLGGGSDGGLPQSIPSGYIDSPFFPLRDWVPHQGNILCESMSFLIVRLFVSQFT